MEELLGRLLEELNKAYPNYENSLALNSKGIKDRVIIDALKEGLIESWQKVEIQDEISGKLAGNGYNFKITPKGSERLIKIQERIPSNEAINKHTKVLSDIKIKNNKVFSDNFSNNKAQIGLVNVDFSNGKFNIKFSKPNIKKFLNNKYFIPVIIIIIIAVISFPYINNTFFSLSPIILNVSIKNVNNSLTGFISPSSCGNSSTPTTYCGYMNLTTQVNITEKINFKKKGIGFLILPEYYNFSYPNLTKGVMPPYKFLGCHSPSNFTCREEYNNSPNSTYQKYIAITSNRSIRSVIIANFSIFMSVNNSKLAFNNIKANLSSNNWCYAGQPCLANLSIHNSNTLPLFVNLRYEHYLNTTLKNLSVTFNGYPYGLCNIDNFTADCSFNYGTLTSGNYSYQAYRDGLQIVFTPYIWLIRGSVPANSSVSLYMGLNNT